mmetsp:Transcript_27420/g.83419  ORF Transcript_27420/g.83419 Transcript_27420/m.83419 type:complete len:105 (-) Transcript_27420:832-1146(-)|eukprot:scaffold211631_cov26-Tisochrysis_lutea.AAC.2
MWTPLELSEPTFPRHAATPAGSTLTSRAGYAQSGDPDVRAATLTVAGARTVEIASAFLSSLDERPAIDKSWSAAVVTSAQPIRPPEHAAAIGLASKESRRQAAA